jgi:RNA polymerase sigma-70 factor (ECF subfamily)
LFEFASCQIKVNFEKLKTICGMDNNEDGYLLNRLKNDDVQALKVLFDRYYSNLCRYLSLIFKNQIIAEHIVQDIFVYLWENRHNLEITSSLESYLHSAGRYKALNHIRNLKRREEIHQALLEGKTVESDESEERMETEELEKVISEAIDSLPARCRKIFLLSREKDLSYKEIAKLLDISLNTVENQMSIALKKLRKILKPYYNRMFLAAISL